jgi:signal transduction histidine kinase
MTSLFMLFSVLIGLSRKSQIGLAFALVCLCFSLSFGGLSMNYFIAEEPNIETWNRLYYFGVAFIPSAFYFLTISFFRLLTRGYRIGLLALVIVSLTFAILAQFHPQFVVGVTKYSFTYTAELGPLGLIFVLYMSLVVFFTLYLWLIHYLKERNPIHRQRLRMLFITFGFSTFALVDFLPGFGVPIYSFGYIIITLFIGFQTYALFVFRLIKIQMLFTLFLHNLVTMFLLAIPWFLIILIISPLNGYFTWQLSWVLSLLAFVLFAPYVLYGFPWIKSLIFKKDFEYQNIIQWFVDEIVILQQPAKLVQSLQTLLHKYLPSHTIHFITKKIERSKFNYWTSEETPQPLPANVDAFFPWLTNHPDIVLKDDIDYDPKYLPVQTLAQHLFTALNAQLIMPIVQANNFIGLIILTSTSTSKPLKAFQLRFLIQLQPFITVAMNNAALYEHIHFLSTDLLEVNETLNQKVEKRSHELEEALAHMKKLNQEQGNFFNMASHHLRTPLTSIKASATLLWAKNPVDKKTGLNSILMENIRRLETLLINIIEIAKMVNGKMTLKFSEIKIQKLILKAYLEVESNFKSKPLDWSFHLDESIQILHADPTRIKTVLVSLFSNAFKFTPKHGKVDVCLTKEKYADIMHKYAQHDLLVAEHYFELTISDTGEGIPEEEQNRIFEIFHQVTDSHKRYQGPGLGLYLVKKIIENHHGAVTLTSRLQHGSQFSFILPDV